MEAVVLMTQMSSERGELDSKTLFFVCVDSKILTTQWKPSLSIPGFRLDSDLR